MGNKTSRITPILCAFERVQFFNAAMLMFWMFPTAQVFLSETNTLPSLYPGIAILDESSMRYRSMALGFTFRILSINQLFSRTRLSSELDQQLSLIAYLLLTISSMKSLSSFESGSQFWTKYCRCRYAWRLETGKEKVPRYAISIIPALTSLQRWKRDCSQSRSASFLPILIFACIVVQSNITPQSYHNPKNKPFLSIRDFLLRPIVIMVKRQWRVFEFNSCIIISSMINPHQNININISYNLTHAKTHKPPPLKKTHKNNKPLLVPAPHCDIEVKLKNKHPEDQRKPSEAKGGNEKKAHKKKASNFARNTFTPDLFNDRRFKTEGPSADLQAVKKENKPKNHSKSTQPAARAIAAAVSSKKSGSTKAVRSGRQGHVNSFLLINPKKTIEPVRRKTQVSYSRNDKVVSKLLNMSLMGSQLGGSRPITSERQSAECHSRTFKEYLSSMDVRLLRTMQDDIPTFARQSHSQQTVKSLMQAKGLSLQQFTSRIILIQRAWKKALSQIVVHKYKQLFRQATDKLSKENKSHQISAFAAQSIASETYNIDFLPPLSSALPLHIPETAKSLSKDDSFEGLPLQWTEEGRRPHLELARYQKLVSEGECGVGGARERTQFDPAILLDAYMEQSEFNRHWIQNEFDPSSSKPSRANSASKACEYSQSEDSLEQSQDYNRVKYASPEEQHQTLEKRIRQLQSGKGREREWRRQREEARDQPQCVIKGYLQCGLGNFGLRVDHKMLEMDERDNEMDSFSDQAIGVRFEQANRNSIGTRPSTEPEPVITPLREGEFEQTVESIIGSLISEFAADISSILRKSTPPPATATRSPPPKSAGVATGFAAVRNYLAQLIAFLKLREDWLAQIVSNINKDIGPTSLQILSYLRPQTEVQIQSQSFQEQGLFVVPAQLFDEFESELEQRLREKQQQMGMRTKAYTNFWHRCIFQSFNQCLDYQRPFGLDGKPYDWITHKKAFRLVQRTHLDAKLHNAQERLLDLTLMVGGIIFEKPDGPFAQADFNDQEKHRINEERLSRILATQLLQSEHSWTSYADEEAELLVELSRIIESAICDEAAIEAQRVRRRRKLLPEGPL